MKFFDDSMLMGFLKEFRLVMMNKLIMNKQLVNFNFKELVQIQYVCSNWEIEKYSTQPKLFIISVFSV